MRKALWKAILIPNHGETVTKRGYRTMADADAAGRGEAPLIFLQRPEVSEIEIVVIYGNEAILNRLVTKEVVK